LLQDVKRKINNFDFQKCVALCAAFLRKSICPLTALNFVLLINPKPVCGSV
jgi:hypothetical protein